MTINEFYLYPEPRTIGFTPKTIYASPSGSGDGTVNNPYSWTAAKAALSVGTTLYLKAGTYTNIDCIFNAQGVSSNRIIIAPEPGLKLGSVILEPSYHFRVNGPFYTFQNLVIRSYYYRTSAVDRFLETTHPNINIGGQGVILKGCILHDFGNNGNWEPAVGAIIEECLILNMGYGNGSLGHSLYIQNFSGTKYIRKNVFSVNYDSAFVTHQYGSGSSDLRGVNYSFNTLINGRALMGGSSIVKDTDFSDNWLINGSVEVGGFDPAGPANEVTGYRNTLLDVKYNVKRAGIFIFKDNYMVIPEGFGSGNTTNVDNLDLNDNDYAIYGTGSSDAFNVNGIVGNLAYIKSNTGQELNSTMTDYSGTVPPDFHEVTQMEDGCIVNICNFSQASTVSVNLTGLAPGNYRAYNAQNHTEYFDFTYSGGSQSFNMTGWTKLTPYATSGGAMNQNAKPLMFPKFGVFYVRSV